MEVVATIGGKYEIIREIGGGGMGKVYLAEDSRLHMKWAVKELECGREYMSSARRAEISVLRRASHPNIPRITDVFSEKGRTYLVMDYIEGRTLEEVIRRGRKIPVRDILRWSVELSSALSYLHSMKPPVIYRDMKPSNIMIRPSGSVALVDFGTAKQYRDENGQDTTALGTRGYAAPEQFEGISDRRSDIYSLGCTIQAVPGSSDSFFLRHIIRKCMRTDPRKRYGNADEVRRSLMLLRDSSKIITASLVCLAAAVFVLAKVKQEAAASESRVQEIVDSGRYGEIYDYALMCFYDLKDYPEALTYFGQLPEEAVPESIYYAELCTVLTSMDADEEQIFEILGRFREFNSGTESAAGTRGMKNDLNIAQIYMTYGEGNRAALKEAADLCERTLDAAEDDKAADGAGAYKRPALSMLGTVYRLMGLASEEEKQADFRKALSCIEELLSMQEVHEDGEFCRKKYRDAARILEELKKTKEALEIYEKSEKEFPLEGQDIYTGHLSLMISTGAPLKDIISLYTEAAEVPGISSNTTFVKIKERISKYEKNS